ncbi:Arc family DNA-binding protein [Shinella sp.]|uniref:Arc family DNA-binding protein n=1 Tax=Shinella sp. TaxID=1870904 RepID=UPI00403732B3
MDHENRYPSQLAERFQIRLPDGMRDEIRIAADLSGRSMNAEIIQRLKSTLESPPMNRLYLDLPDELEKEMSLDALARHVDMGDRAIEILSNAYSAAPQGFAQKLNRLEDEIVRNADLTELASDLKKQLERDFVLYYGKVTQISQFINHLLASAGDTLPADLRKSAQDLQALSEAELSTLRHRYEDGLFWVQRRENEARNARDIAATDSSQPAWDDIARNAHDLAHQLSQVHASKAAGVDLDAAALHKIARMASDLVTEMNAFNGTEAAPESRARGQK